MCWTVTDTSPYLFSATKRRRVHVSLHHMDENVVHMMEMKQRGACMKRQRG
jgi:hypothetical protein